MVALAPLAFRLAGLLAAHALGVRAQGDWGVAYAPATTGAPRPAIVFLHGMWATPEDSCNPFARAGAPFGFVVCPRGNAPLGDAGNLTLWSGSAADAGRQVHAALAAAEALAPGTLAPRGGTLLGFSNGAYFAAEVACAEPGTWSGLVLMSMKLDLDPARLSRAGVARVVLAAGDRDEARASMQSLAARLADGGVKTRFMSLGDVGHAFPPDMAHRMCDALAWVTPGAPASICAGL